MASNALHAIVKIGLDSTLATDGIEEIDLAIARAAIETCAVEIESFGCACAQLAGELFAESVMLAVEPHNSACPIALAAHLRRLV